MCFDHYVLFHDKVYFKKTKKKNLAYRVSKPPANTAGVLHPHITYHSTSLLDSSGSSGSAGGQSRARGEAGPSSGSARAPASGQCGATGSSVASSSNVSLKVIVAVVGIVVSASVVVIVIAIVIVIIFIAVIVMRIGITSCASASHSCWGMHMRWAVVIIFIIPGKKKCTWFTN